MTVAQGINKTTAYKAQSGLGTPATGAGGFVLRRKTSVAGIKRATYANDEIVTHQQSTGVNLGTASSAWNFDGLLSPGSYSGLLATLMRKVFTATTALTGLSLTITMPGSIPTITRGSGDFLAGGIKIGDVIRITAGTYANANNRDNNLLVTGVTALVITGVTLNGSLMVAEGPIASSTVTVMGKKAIVPTTGHTDTLVTVEEWYADISKSELFPDLRIGQCDIGLPASGNSTIKLTAMGLGVRTGNVTQQLTSPTSPSSANVLTAVRGLIRVAGGASTVITGAQLTIKAALTAEGPVVGSNYSPDMARGRVEVSGTFTGLFDGTTFRDLFDAETLTSLVVVMATDTTNAADFVAFSMSAIKLTDSDPDDGEKGIVRSYPFTAQINALGSSVLANDNTILSIQDSLAA